MSTCWAVVGVDGFFPVVFSVTLVPWLGKICQKIMVCQWTEGSGPLISQAASANQESHKQCSARKAWRVGTKLPHELHQSNRVKVTWLVGALSPVNHEGLYQGWGRLSYSDIYIVKRTNTAGRRLEEQSEKVESCQENLWNEIRWKGHKNRNRHKKRMKRSGQSSVGLCQRQKPQHPHHVKESLWGRNSTKDWWTLTKTLTISLGAHSLILGGKQHLPELWVQTQIILHSTAQHG